MRIAACRHNDGVSNITLRCGLILAPNNPPGHASFPLEIKTAAQPKTRNRTTVISREETTRTSDVLNTNGVDAYCE